MRKGNRVKRGGEKERERIAVRGQGRGGGEEGERENGEDDVGKEEANQKRKYALARPEALRSIVSRAAFSSLNCNFI